MTSKLTGRIMKIEKRTAPVDIAKWMHLPVREVPDWVLCTILLDRPVGPAEADRLNKDDEFWTEIEALVASPRQALFAEFQCRWSNGRSTRLVAVDRSVEPR